MRRLMIVIAAIALMSADWQTNFSKAKDKAKAERKYILLNFSGSDWCVPCIRTKKEIFDQKTFAGFADSNLVLVNADFPRLKKHSLTQQQTKDNYALADQFNKQGVFPLTILMTPEGHVVKQWTGVPASDPQQFVNEIRTVECSK